MTTRPRLLPPTLFALALALAPAARAQQQPARADAARADTSAAAAAPSEVRGGAITVRVVGEDNQPIANAFVSAQRLGASSNFANDNSGATTGRYVLLNLDPGVYRVSVHAPGFVPDVDPAADPSESNLFRPGDTASFRLVKGGVITGRVTDAAGAPVVGTPVAVVRVRDAAGRPVAGVGFESFYSRWRADDRGTYRVYGLSAGSYLVRAAGRGSQNFGSRPSAYDGDAPTYYPSATRDGAVEVQVQPGQELTDIDICHRGERGHAISGTVTGAFAAGDFGAAGAAVSLRRSDSAETEGFAYVVGAGETRSFTMDGIPDGDYDLTASSGGSDKETGTASAVLRVAVRGADVTGLRLALAPLSSVAGRVAFEPLGAADAARPECKGLRQPAMYEALLVATRDERTTGTPSSHFASSPERAPDERGDFMLRNLVPGRYRLALRLPDDNLFARSIRQAPASNAAASAPAAGQANTAAKPSRPNVADIARDGFSVAPGERLAGVTVNVAQGAASLRGRLAAADDSEQPAGTWRVHLVPAEAERADDVLRYAETLARPDGSFAFRNLAPGRYHLLARAVADSELRRPAAQQRRAAWDAATRAELRREAEAAKTSVALTPCQRAEDFTLRVNVR